MTRKPGSLPGNQHSAQLFDGKGSGEARKPSASGSRDGKAFLFSRPIPPGPLPPPAPAARAGEGVQRAQSSRKSKVESPESSPKSKVESRKSRTGEFRNRPAGTALDRVVRSRGERGDDSGNGP